jgi:prolipoprotein diacylglyceryltransferase
MCYAVFRSLVELFRGDYPPDHIHNGLTSAQLVSIPIFVAGLLIAVMLSHRGIKRR